MKVGIIGYQSFGLATLLMLRESMGERGHELILVDTEGEVDELVESSDDEMVAIVGSKLVIDPLGELGDFDYIDLPCCDDFAPNQNDPFTMKGNDTGKGDRRKRRKERGWHRNTKHMIRGKKGWRTK